MYTLKLIGYSFTAALAVSLMVLLVAGFLFGFQFAEWPEWEGRIVGIVGTIAGAIGAAVGLWLVRRAEKQAVRMQ